MDNFHFNMVKVEKCDDDIDTIEAQRKLLDKCVNSTLEEGKTWYLVSKKWFESLKHYLGYNDSFESREPCHPGPIDNSDILEDCNGDLILREHLVDEEDYVLFPQDGWDYFYGHYGLQCGQEPIAREVVNFGQFSKHLKVEVYLLEFELCKDFDLSLTLKHKFSRKATTAFLHETARRLFNVPHDVRTQLFSSMTDGSYQPITLSDRTTCMEEMVYPSAKIILDSQGPDGVWSSAAHVVKRDTRDYSSTSSLSYRKEQSKSSAIALPASSMHGTSSSMTTRYSVAHANVTPGLCGLSNLGNTCFMNSVLQCMSNIPPITDYFLNDLHLKDLNVENPLGMRGEIAKSFGELIKTMWSSSCTIPLQFKHQVSKFAPQFSGYQQHDAQELLTFLLDGLHEDLNRIHDKPYIKQRDSDGRPDEEVATEAWSNYKKRNDSIIVELFHGLLKSTVWCPRCKITSVTFDPLCYLSLPLPTKLERYFDVIFYPYSGDKKPTRFKVLVPHRAQMEDVFKALNKLTGYPVDQMIATEIVKNHFQKIFDRNDCVDSFFEDRDILHVYQVPVSVDDRRFIQLPVCQWELDSQKRDFTVNQLFGLPVFVVLPREECTYGKLFKAILDRLAPYLSIRVTSNPAYNNFDDDSMQFNGDMKDEDNNDEEDEDDDSEDKPSNSDGHESMDVSLEYTGSASTDLDVCGEDWDKDEDSDRMYINGDSGNQNSSFRFFIVNNQKLRPVCVSDIDTKVIAFPDVLGRQYLVVQWTSATRRLHFKDSSVNDIEKHESCLGYMRPHGVDLTDCLTLYTSTEKLDASEAWYCPRCKDHIEATKKFDLWNLPRILVIHLKRFQYNRFRRDKIDTTVLFPLRHLDLKDYVTDPNYKKSTVYDLIGVCNHYGNLAGGHYTAYGLNKVEKAWYLFDDNHVRRASESSVVSNSAYVLFYMRRDGEEMKH